MTETVKVPKPKAEKRAIAFEIKEVSEKGIFTGYGSVFGELDFGNDIVEKGAFTRTLKEAKAKNRKFPVLWQHKGTEPIGIYDDIYEDDKGLYVEGRLLINDVQRAKEAYALMDAGAVTGLSIGYGAKEYKIDTDDWVRTLLDVDLYEVSPVTFPMLDVARVDAVKTLVEHGELPSLKEFENFLREAGFSRTQSAAIASKGLSALLQSESAQANSATIVEALKGFSIKS